VRAKVIAALAVVTLLSRSVGSKSFDPQKGGHHLEVRAYVGRYARHAGSPKNSGPEVLQSGPRQRWSSVGADRRPAPLGPPANPVQRLIAGTPQARPGSTVANEISADSTVECGSTPRPAGHGPAR
jgi:hypothetical protein